MAIDFKTAFVLCTRRYLAPTVVVLLLLSGSMAYVWSEYRNLLKERDQLAAERKAFNDERVLSEKMRADAAIALMAHKAEIEKREFVLQQLEGQNKERLAALQQRSAEYEVAFGNLQQEKTTVSESRRLKEAEEKIQMLMSQFSAMGVDLDATIGCGDSEGLARHNAAKAKFTEIYTMAEAYGLTKRYNNFFFHNSQHLHWPCQK